MNLRIANVAGCLLTVLLLITGCGKSESTSGNEGSTKNTVTETSTDAGEQSPGENGSRKTQLLFEEVTDKSGVAFVNRNGEEAEQFAIVESLGGGVGVIDVDRDGHEDLMLPGGGEMTAAAEPVGLLCGLFRNRGAWKFEDVSAAAGVDQAKLYSHGCACGDFNKDGFPDALITGYGGLLLFENRGDGTFEEVAMTSGLSDQSWSSSAAWGDITGDGVLDLYVAHYVNWGPDHNPFCPGPTESQREVCPPRDFDGLPDLLYVGNGDGTFHDASKDFAIRQDGKGLGVLVADLDGDRDLDIYVTNDTVPNVLYRNDNGSALEDDSLISGASLSARGVPDGSMGVQLLDYDQDGQFDIWVANYERETSALYAGQGNLLFRHVSQRTGVTAVGAAYVGWGTLCFDADHDGDEDVFVANGHVIRYPRAAPLKQLPLLMENLAGGRFRNVASSAGSYTSSGHMARGCAAADFDGDGDLDMAVMHTNDPISLLRNDSETGGFLTVELFGMASSRDPIGATVSVITERQSIHRQLSGGGSYASTNSRRLHFGLGAAEAIEEVVVQWPSGEVQKFRNVEPNVRMALVESRGLVSFQH